MDTSHVCQTNEEQKCRPLLLLTCACVQYLLLECVIYIAINSVTETTNKTITY